MKQQATPREISTHSLGNNDAKKVKVIPCSIKSFGDRRIKASIVLEPWHWWKYGASFFLSNVFLLIGMYIQAIAPWAPVASTFSNFRHCFELQSLRGKCPSPDITDVAYPIL